MSTKYLFNMETICRLCLNSSSESQYVTIDDDRAISIRQKINVFLPELIIDITDNPQICMPCSQLLDKFYDFRLVCLDTEQRIRCYIDENNHNLPVNLALITQRDWIDNAVNAELKDGNVDYLQRNLTTANQDPFLDDVEDKRSDLEDNLQDTDEDLACNVQVKLEESTNVNENCEADVKCKLEDESVSLKYICQFCKVTFGNRLTYLRHLRKHNNSDTNLNCDVCLKTFSKSWDLKRHRKTHVKPYQCNMCGEKFTKYKLLVQHFAIHKSLPVSCDICNKGFTTRGHLKLHLVNIHTANVGKQRTEDNKLTCDICLKTFFKNWDLNRHIKTHEKIHQCNVCNENFIDHKSLLEHHMIHKNQPITCTICNKSFSTRSHLKTHLINIHAANITKQKFECQACNKVFYSKEELLQHSPEHTGMKSYICYICGKGFQGPTYLKQHIRNHNAARSHTCTICGMGFTQKYTLTSHMRTHTGERPYKCDKCGKGFSQNGSLLTHMRSVHSTEKRFACDLCPMKFMFKVSLRLHIQKHLGTVEKRHTCEVCGKSFRLAYALKSHTLRHTNGSTHTCIVCKKGFIGSGALKRHMRTHTGEKPFECHICHFKCTQKYNLRIHINSHIKNKMSSAYKADEFKNENSIEREMINI